MTTSNVAAAETSAGRYEGACDRSASIWQTRSAGAALAAGVLAAAGVVGLRRPDARWVRRLWGLAAAGGLVVYGAAYVTATTGRLDETIAWLSWYLSWPVLGLAGLGLAGLGLARLGLVRRATIPGESPLLSCRGSDASCSGCKRRRTRQVPTRQASGCIP